MHPLLLQFNRGLVLNEGIFYTALLNTFFFFVWRCGPAGAMAYSFLRFIDHTQRRITVGRTPLDEWLARRRDLYLTTHNTHNRQTSMPSVGFETTIAAGERPQSYALDRAVTGTGITEYITLQKARWFWMFKSSGILHRADWWSTWRRFGRPCCLSF